MSTCLVDANVWLAFLTEEHQHHTPSRRWFEELVRGEAGICRVVQLSLLRLMCNRTIMGPGVLPTPEAWMRVAYLLQDERVDFVPEPPGINAVLPDLLRYPVPTGKLINDAYLAAFAISSNCELVTWDRGFQQFRGLRVRLLQD